mmetsp:Transcript_8157/g.26992  ORF Transcript_8157/g.26992 Transcript_8157/m.26992 type:complete len:302 (+) Transcript_8157:1356-2261(+)
MPSARIILSPTSAVDIGAPPRQRATSLACPTSPPTASDAFPAVNRSMSFFKSAFSRMRAHTASCAMAPVHVGPEPMTPSWFTNPPGASAACINGAPYKSVTLPPAARTMASGAHVSQSDVPKCMSANSARPSATASNLFPAPPMTPCEYVAPLSKAAVFTISFAAMRAAFLESPLTERISAVGLSYLIGHGTPRAPWTPMTPRLVPGATMPNTAQASARSTSPSGNGNPITPATARPRTAIPIKHCTACNLDSTNSRVPSTGSMNNVTSAASHVNKDKGANSSPLFAIASAHKSSRKTSPV